MLRTLECPADERSVAGLPQYLLRINSERPKSSHVLGSVGEEAMTSATLVYEARPYSLLVARSVRFRTFWLGSFQEFRTKRGRRNHPARPA